MTVLHRAARSGGPFLGVGGLAAGVHAGVVWLLVASSHLLPLVANLGGFAVAFWVSFFGHRHFSFRQARPGRWQQALPRFALVALLAFVTNEGLYALLLRFTHLPYLAALILVLVLVAGGTYLLSRFWAFRPA